MLVAHSRERILNTKVDAGITFIIKKEGSEPA